MHCCAPNNYEWYDINITENSFILPPTRTNPMHGPTHLKAKLNEALARVGEAECKGPRTESKENR